MTYNDAINDVLVLLEEYSSRANGSHAAVYYGFMPIKKAIEALKRKTNLEEMSDSTPEHAYEVMHWLFFEYALEYTDAKQAIINWLKADKDTKGE